MLDWINISNDFVLNDNEDVDMCCEILCAKILSLIDDT